MVKRFLFWDDEHEYEEKLNDAFSDIKGEMESERPVIFLRNLFRFNTYISKQTDIHMMTILVLTSILMLVIGLNYTLKNSIAHLIVWSVILGLLMSLVNLYWRYFKNKTYFESWLSREDIEREEERAVVNDEK